MASRTYGTLLALIFAAAFGLRVGLTAYFQGISAPQDCETNPDACQYELLAYNVSDGRGYVLEPDAPTACRSPGTSLTLLPVYLLSDRSAVLARVWWCLISALTCVATAWAGAACFDRRVGLIAAASTAFYPGSFYFTMHFVSEVPFGLYLALATGATVNAWHSRNAWSGVGAGVLWGAAALTRPQLLPALPLAWLAALASGKEHWRVNLWAMTLVSLGVAATLTPWVVRNAVVIGKPTMTTILGGYGFWFGNNEEVLNDPALCGMCPVVEDLMDAEHPLRGGELERESAAWRYGLEFVKNHVADVPRLCMMKIYRLITPFEETTNRAVYWAFALGWIVAAPLVVVGSVIAWRRSPLPGVILLIPLAAVIAVTLVFYGLIRYRDAYAPTFLILAAVAMNAWLVRWSTRPHSEQ
jgi:hypothetical protein